MSKFFIQMFVSLMVAVSAAVGFGPDVRGEVHKTLREVKMFAHEITQPIYGTVSSLATDAEGSVEAAAETAAETEVNGEAESEMITDLDLDLENISDDLSAIGRETSFSTETETESESEAELASDPWNLDLEYEIESAAGLEVSVGR